MRKKNKNIITAAVVIAVMIIIAAILFVSLSSFKPVVIESGHYGFTSDMISYLIGEELDDYVKYYENNPGQNFLDAVSLDPEKSLKRQDSPYGSSWFDYFYDISVKKAKNIIFDCEAANKEGISLSTDEKSRTASMADKISQKNGIKKENLKKLLLYKALSDKYKDTLYSKSAASDYEEYYNQNRKKYDCIDYKCVTVRIEVEQAFEKEKIDKLSREAEDRANKLLSDVKLYGFDRPVQDYLQETESSDTLDKFFFKSQKYIEKAPFFEWAFSSERKSGDVVMFPGKYSFSVYFLEKTPYPYDYTMIDGVIAVSDYKKNKTDYLTKLRSKLAKTGDGKENFDKFVSSNGFSVLGNDVILKESPLPEPVLKWMYSDDRKPDDAELCVYGEKVYAMLYVGSKGSYFDYVLKNDYQQSVYDLFIKESSKSTKIEIKSKYKFLICG